MNKKIIIISSICFVIIVCICAFFLFFNKKNNEDNNGSFYEINENVVGKVTCKKIVDLEDNNVSTSIYELIYFDNTYAIKDIKRYVEYLPKDDNEYRLILKGAVDCVDSYLKNQRVVCFQKITFDRESPLDKWVLYYKNSLIDDGFDCD